jgi:hypothetical protein
MNIKEVEINGYIVTFDYKENKCKIRRKDNVKIDTSSKKFVKDLNEIKKTKEYGDNFRLMNLHNMQKTKSTLSDDTNERLLEFAKGLLRE